MRWRLLGILLCVIFCAGALVPGFGTAQEASPAKGDDDWHFLFYLPGWIAAFQTDVSARGNSTKIVTTQTQTLEFIFNDLNAIGLGHLEIKKGRWGFLMEGIYLNIGDSGNFATKIELPTVPLVQIPVTGRIKAKVELSFNEAAVLYDAYRSSSTIEERPVLTLEALGGIRYVYFRTKIEATIVGPLGTTKIVDQGKRDWFDPILGGRLAWNLSDHWMLGFRTDIGGFGITSDITVNLDTAIRYRFTDWLNMNVGYRGLYMHHEEGSFNFDGWIHGPWMGVGVEF
jgi:hypothetical protein